MDSISYWALLWNWFERRVLRHPVARLLPRHPGWTDFVHEAEAGGGEPILPPELAANLEQQLNSLTPRHIHTTIRVGPQGTAIRTRRWRWLESESSLIPRDADDEADIMTQLLNVLLHVQWFICNATNRAWPSETPLPRSPSEPSRENFERHAAQLDALVPDAEVSLDDGVAKLWWEHEGRIILALEPIPLVGP